MGVGTIPGMEPRNSPRLVLPGNGDAAQEPMGVRMHGVVEDLLHRAGFHDLPGIHDRQPVSDSRHDSQIMGNQDHGHVELALQILQQMENLGLDGDVQGGSRFIGNDQLRART